jgi:hypothetical protein
MDHALFDFAEAKGRHTQCAKLLALYRATPALAANGHLIRTLREEEHDAAAEVGFFEFSLRHMVPKSTSFEKDEYVGGVDPDTGVYFRDGVVLGPSRVANYYSVYHMRTHRTREYPCTFLSRELSQMPHSIF